MDTVDLSVLRQARAWHGAGHAVTLVTVIETWGSAPRPPGALLALRDDGVIAGSVSGGCVEDDLIDRVRRSPSSTDAALPGLVVYGVTRDEAARFGLPCGGTLRLVQEPLRDSAWIDELLQRCDRHELVARTLDLSDGQVRLTSATRLDALRFDGRTLVTVHGPRWRLLIIGAGQLTRYLADIAVTLGFEILICDPREEVREGFTIANARFVDGMPDDAVIALEPDAHTAIVALTHDPKLDDLALLEALKSPAFYVGALGSHANTAKRKTRLAMFDLTQEEIERLHGPVGLSIGSRTPAEIAVAVAAEIVAVRARAPIVDSPRREIVGPATDALRISS